MVEMSKELLRFTKELLEDDQVQNIGMKKDEDLFTELYEKFHKKNVGKKLIVRR